ncbi:hypothetical protein GCM10022199_11410 [Marihabitans asiaticum]|uniref:NADH dehydrogenase subunit B n=2 Tax=Marihabitans asiaticum TaxID=415218 RepID=A0A560WHK9_9MICO|nr:NADH dehydrogenase subunit B [Marihabitans asiaticum]
MRAVVRVLLMPTDLPLPTVGAGADPAPRTVRLGGRRYDVHVHDLGLACCAMEFVAAAQGEGLDRLGVLETSEGPERADVLVVSGTITDAMAPGVQEVYDRMPGPRYVLSFGACSNSGGPYWDSYCVTKGVDQLVPVDVYVPGCPPRPEALLHGLARLHRQIAAEHA